MNSKLIRHQRVVNVRDMILKGAKHPQLIKVLLKSGVDRGTAQSYINEVVKDIKRKMKK